MVCCGNALNVNDERRTQPPPGEQAVGKSGAGYRGFRRRRAQRRALRGSARRRLRLAFLAALLASTTLAEAAAAACEADASFDLTAGLVGLMEAGLAVDMRLVAADKA
jgi:hypothetical protein